VKFVKAEKFDLFPECGLDRYEATLAKGSSNAKVLANSSAAKDGGGF
jgi:hypothetical protein